jgi:hypothetical protein
MITFNFNRGRTIGLLAALGVLGLHGVTPLAGAGTARAQTTPDIVVQYGGQNWPYQSVTETAAQNAGFSPEARASVAWSTATLNLYAGDPAWLDATPAVPVQGSPADYLNRPAGGAQHHL